MSEKTKKNRTKEVEPDDNSSSSSDSSDRSDSSSEDEKSSKYGKYIKKLKVIKKRLEKKERELEKCEKKLKAEKDNNAELTKFATEQTDTIYKLKSEKEGSKNTDNLLKNTEDRMERVIIKNADYLKEKFDHRLDELKSALTYVRDNMARKQDVCYNTAEIMEADTRIIGESYQEEYFTTHGNEPDYNTPRNQRLSKTIDTTDDLRNRITSERFEDSARIVTERKDDPVELARENAEV